MSRPTRARIHLDAVVKNLQQVRARAPGKSCMAVVKADAYGHGLDSVSRALAPHTDAFAVAIPEEAKALLALRRGRPIVVLEGPSGPQDLQDLQGPPEAPVQWVLHDSRQLRWVQEAGVPLWIWLKCNTGMNRLGFPAEQVPALYAQCQQLPQVTCCGLMNHFACADQPDSSSHMRQQKCLQSLRKHLPDASWSIANSAVLLGPGHDKGDWIRPGIALYGSSPLPGVSRSALGLQVTMELLSELITTRILAPGDQVGYGATWSASQVQAMGVIPLGYADGLQRLAGHQLEVVINGRQAPLIGRVSMDMCAVDLSRHPEAVAGTAVEFWGPQIEVDEQAQRLGTIAYELMAGLTARVRRAYQ